MSKFTFLLGKDKSIEVYKAACVLSETEFNLNNFLKNYPKEELDTERFIKKWRSKELSILLEIESVYKPFNEGKILIGLFPKREIFWKLPKDYRKCFTFGLNKKAYIILFPTIEDKEFSFKILIHELFHANDVLRGEFGRVETERHKWFEEKAQEIFKKYF